MRIPLSALGARLTILRCPSIGALYRALVMQCPKCHLAGRPEHNAITIAYHYADSRVPGINPSLEATGSSIDTISLDGEYGMGHSCGLHGSVKGGHWIDHGHE